MSLQAPGPVQQADGRVRCVHACGTSAPHIVCPDGDYQKKPTVHAGTSAPDAAPKEHAQILMAKLSWPNSHAQISPALHRTNLIAPY